VTYWEVMNHQNSSTVDIAGQAVVTANQYITSSISKVFAQPSILLFSVVRVETTPSAAFGYSYLFVFKGLPATYSDHHINTL